MNATVLTNATVLDGVRPAVRGCSVVLESERITSVGPDPVQPGPDDRAVPRTDYPKIGALPA